MLKMEVNQQEEVGQGDCGYWMRNALVLSHFILPC